MIHLENCIRQCARTYKTATAAHTVKCCFPSLNIYIYIIGCLRLRPGLNQTPFTKYNLQMWLSQRQVLTTQPTLCLEGYRQFPFTHHSLNKFAGLLKIVIRFRNIFHTGKRTTVPEKGTVLAKVKFLLFLNFNLLVAFLPILCLFPELLLKDIQ